MYWLSLKESVPWTACGPTPTSASTAARTCATWSTLSSAASASPWNGAANSHKLPSPTSGTSLLASRSWRSTVDAARSCTECVSTAAWILSVKPAVCSSTRLRNHSRRSSIKTTHTILRFITTVSSVQQFSLQRDEHLKNRLSTVCIKEWNLQSFKE